MAEIRDKEQVHKRQDDNFIKFLGTAGARFVMIEQLRASGGLWICANNTNIIVDPGPGSIVRCNASRPRLDPLKLDGIILTHCHLDHCNDINVMIEAMTEGGFKKRGTVFCPRQATASDGVILTYLKKFPEKITRLLPLASYKAGKFAFKTSMRHIHPVETYGLKFKINKTTVALLTDTKYFAGLKAFYKADVLVLYVVFAQERPDIAHLSLPDAETLIRTLKPKKAILTHFGRTMLKANPRLQAEILTQKTGIEVIAAYDGMKLEF